jgi:hypothetical protein
MNANMQFGLDSTQSAHLEARLAAIRADADAKAIAEDRLRRRQTQTPPPTPPRSVRPSTPQQNAVSQFFGNMFTSIGEAFARAGEAFSSNKALPVITPILGVSERLIADDWVLVSFTPELKMDTANDDDPTMDTTEDGVPSAEDVDLDVLDTLPTPRRVMPTARAAQLLMRVTGYVEQDLVDMLLQQARDEVTAAVVASMPLPPSRPVQ